MHTISCLSYHLIPLTSHTRIQIPTAFASAQKIQILQNLCNCEFRLLRKLILSWNYFASQNQNERCRDILERYDTSQPMNPNS